MKITKFEDLKIWKLSLSVVKIIYDITSRKDFMKDWGLINQLRRSSVSISSNIVEGFEKNNNNEFIRYLKIAKGSAGELKNQLYISFEVGYLNKIEVDRMTTSLEKLSGQIGAFISYLESKRSNKEFLPQK